jgi:hypothetical protein
LVVIALVVVVDVWSGPDEDGAFDPCQRWFASAPVLPTDPDCESRCATADIHATWTHCLIQCEKYCRKSFLEAVAEFVLDFLADVPLNTLEQRLVAEHPVEAVVVRRNALFAQQVMRENFPDQETARSPRADAFRHCGVADARPGF